MTPVKKIDHRPASGSCARCRASLSLASVKVADTWYCSTACAEGRPTACERESAVPESWLTNRPRRFYSKRRPKELQSVD